MELEKIYRDLVHKIMSSYGKTYSAASAHFPKEKRDDVAAFYAFVRVADEVVDNPPNYLSKRDQVKLLDNYVVGLKESVRMKYSTDPVLHMFARVVIKYDIDLKLIDAFINSMKMDISKNQYKTFEDLRRYTYGSAEVIGLVMARIMGVVDKKTLEGARILGLSFQLTNFLRDVTEDYGQGRIYLLRNYRSFLKKQNGVTHIKDTMPCLDQTLH